jgi:ankyrin repeat protein
MARSEDGCTPLYIAAQNGHAAVVSVLIAAGADVNKARASGGTPLYIAAQRGHAGVVDLLIAAGANVNATRKNGTALNIALANGQTCSP